MEDPSNLKTSQFEGQLQETMLQKRDDACFELSIVNMKSKNSKRGVKKEKNQLAILKGASGLEGRFSTKRRTKNYAVFVVDEENGTVEMVPVPYHFVMEKEKKDGGKGLGGNKVVKMDEIDSLTRKEMLVREIGTNKSRKVFDKLKNKKIQVYLFSISRLNNLGFYQNIYKGLYCYMREFN